MTILSRPAVPRPSYDEAVRDSAQVRIDLARKIFREEGIEAIGEVDGFVKTVFDAKTGELLGAHMIGAEVTELIQGYTVGKTAELIDESAFNEIYNQVVRGRTGPIAVKPAQAAEAKPPPRARHPEYEAPRQLRAPR